MTPRARRALFAVVLFFAVCAVAGGILLAVAVIWILLRIWYPGDDEPGNYPP